MREYELNSAETFLLLSMGFNETTTVLWPFVLDYQGEPAVCLQFRHVSMMLFVCQRKPEDEEASADDAKKLKTVDTETESVTDAPATVSAPAAAETATVSAPAVTETAAESATMVNGCSEAVNGTDADEPAVAVNDREEKMEVTGDAEIKVRSH